LRITILNWDRINGRKDVFNPTWFKFKHSFFEDHEFFDFTAEERLFWVYLLCLASQKSSNTVYLVYEHAERLAGFSRQCIDTTLSKLKRIRCIGTKDDGAMEIIGEGKKRERARRAVYKAVRLGKMVKPNKCAECSLPDGKTQAHHVNYDEPLSVIWLCTKCHGKKHKGIKRLTEWAAARRTRTVARRTDGGRAAAARVREELEKNREENTLAQSSDCATPFDFESLYKKYPRKLGKHRGLVLCKAQIKTDLDYQALSLAIDQYAAHCQKQATEPKYIKHFSTFMGSWRDWLEPDAGHSEDFSGNEIDWSKFT
jgi:hypothetical protein